MYLIVKCESSDWSADDTIEHTPMFMTSNWKENIPGYNFEVWKVQPDNTLECIKDFYTPMESGMAFYYWPRGDDPEEIPPTIIQKFPGRTRNDSCPGDIMKKLESMENCEDWLSSCGTISAINGDDYYVYGEYWDHHFAIGY